MKGEQIQPTKGSWALEWKEEEEQKVEKTEDVLFSGNSASGGAPERTQCIAKTI